MKSIFTFFLLWLLPLMLLAQPYLNETTERVVLGNQAFEWRFDIAQCKLQPLRLINKIDRSRYRLSGGLFAAEVTFPGETVTPPARVPQRLTAADFLLDKVTKTVRPDGLVADFHLSGQGLRLIYSVFIPRDKPFFRVWLQITDDSDAQPFLEKVSPLSLTLPALDGQLGGFGQPVYGADLFFGVEFPAARNEVRGNTVRCTHYAAQKIPAQQFYRSHAVVIGLSREGRVRDDFLSYIRSLRPRPDRPFVLYNTWYDVRDFRTDSLLNTVRRFKSTLIDRYGLKLNAFVLDDGWDDVSSVWEIDRQKLPQGFQPLVRALKPLHSALGLWISPWNGYEPKIKKRIEWAAAHGFKTSAGRHLCLGDTAYFNLFKRKVLQYQREGQLSFYKIDGFLSVCNESDHNHLPGIYSRELLTRKFIDILQALRKQNPDIFIDITVGTWLSPWWLQYADAVWMTGADFGHAEDVPALSERDKAITFRDYTLYKDFVRDRLQFPLANVMTHGIIKGRLNLLGGPDETLQNWMNNTVMYFARGVMLWELYLSPQVLSRAEWDFLARVMKWGYAHQHILQNTRFIGGDPYRRQVYGYVHQADDEALVIVRNPFVRPRTFALSFGDVFPRRSDENFVAETLYPQRMVFGQRVNKSNPLTIDLAGYEVKVLRLRPAAHMPPLPTGLSLEPLAAGKNEAEFRLFADPQTAHISGFVGSDRLKRLILNGKSVNVQHFESLVNAALQRRQKAEVLPADFRVELSPLTRRQIKATLRGPQTKGRIGILLDFVRPADSLRVRLTVGEKPIKALIKKGAQGLWYWILIPAKALKAQQALQVQIDGDRLLPHGKIGFWHLWRQALLPLGTVKIQSKKAAFSPRPQIPVQAAERSVTDCLLESAF